MWCCSLCRCLVVLEGPGESATGFQPLVSRQRGSARIQEEETGGTCWRSGTSSLPRRSKSNECNGQTISSGPGTVQSHSTPERWDLQRGATDGEIGARRDALVTIFGAEPLSLETEPQLPQAKTRIPPETHVKYKVEDAQWAVAQLSSGKAGPCIRSGGPADQDKFGGAVAEQWNAVVGQRAQAPLPACAQAFAAA